MTRVLIVVANREQFPEPAFPVRGAVRGGGGGGRRRRARVFDAGLYRRPLAALRAELRGLGGPTPSASRCATPTTPPGRTRNTYTGWYAQVAAAVREAAPQARLVLGGPAFSIFPRGDAPRPARPRRRGRRRRGGGAAARRGRAAGGHRRAAARRPRRASRLPADLARRLPRRRALPHRRRPDARAAARTAASTAPIRGWRARACGGARPRRSSTRWSGCAASSARSSSSSSTRRSTPTRAT